MRYLSRFMTHHAMYSQRQVAARAARVIDHVIFDLGVGRLVQGTVQLDGRLRPHFFSEPAHQAAGALARVPLSALAEAAVLAQRSDPLGQAPREAVGVLVEGLLREFRAQSARFRALPD